MKEWNLLEDRNLISYFEMNGFHVMPYSQIVSFGKNQFYIEKRIEFDFGQGDTFAYCGAMIDHVDPGLVGVDFKRVSKHCIRNFLKAGVHGPS